MSGYYDEVYAVYNESFPRARTVHTCDACKEPIPVGHRYARVGLVFDGGAETISRCMRCQRIHEHLRHLPEAIGELWPDERLDCGEEYKAHWGVEPPEEIAQLAFMTPEEVQVLDAATRLNHKTGGARLIPTV